MTSPRPGYYQNELRDLRGNAMAVAVVAVFNVGTTTPATIYSDDARTPMTASPLPAAVGLNRPGIDTAGNIAFFAEDLDASGNAVEYDVRVTYGGNSFTLRARPVPAPHAAPAGELGSVAAYSNFSTTGSGGEPIPGTTIPVVVGSRPVKITASATLTASVADTLGAVVIYEDADIIGFLHWTAPKASAYQRVTGVHRRSPAAGLHAYQAYIANYSATGTFGLYSVDPTNVGLEIVVEEI